jgi:RHS repeat-associated protein
LATTAGGGVNDEMRYYPYGEARSGSMSTDRRFTGQREETAIGLYDYNARYYDPVIGSFIQADTIVPEPGNPQALNRYAYVYNNPLIIIDPSGHQPKPPEKDVVGLLNMKHLDAWGYRIEGTLAPMSFLGDVTIVGSILEPSPLTEVPAAGVWLLSKSSVDINIDLVFNLNSVESDDKFNILATVSGGGLTEGGSISGGPLFFWGLENSDQLVGTNMEAGGTFVMGTGGVELALGYSPALGEDQEGVTSLYISPGTAIGAEVSAYGQIGHCWNITQDVFNISERLAQAYRSLE